MSKLYGQKWFGIAPRFNPGEGETIVEPPGEGYGFWAGAPSAIFDYEGGKFYLSYRRRWPLYEGRGGECCVAESEDGVNFKTIWTAKKEDFGANSIEGSSIIRDPSGEWRLYISFEVAKAYDRNPPTWRVSLMQADSPENFRPELERPVMDGPMFGFTFVKDPSVYIMGGEYWAFTSVGIPDQGGGVVEGEDIRQMGRGSSALITSPDGIHFNKARVVLGPSGEDSSMDCFQARITSILYLPPVWSVFYDAARHRADGYDEFCCLAVTRDFVNFSRLSLREPWVKSPHASGCIRYLDALMVEGEIHYFYEYARADRSHELRHNKVVIG